MAEDQGAKKADDAKRVHTYPLVKFGDMAEDMQVDAQELCVTACEKFSTDNEAAARFVKETMDKKFGAAWHVAVGEGYGFEITYDKKNLLHMFYGGNMAITLWKCS
ncbi:unnamed protein product [Calicophoron daubneyi]|uniref:Dynein light chain n=1 Tax=Calicophoron daubneyi TaxID=300641 RepID=A0AAV2TQC3_CALDB